MQLLHGELQYLCSRPGPPKGNKELFERLLIELKPVKNHATEMIRTLLLQFTPR